MKLHFHSNAGKAAMASQSRIAENSQEISEHIQNQVLSAGAPDDTPLNDAQFTILQPAQGNDFASAFTYPRPNAQLPDYIGFKRFHITSQEMTKNEHGQLSTQYAYGDLTDKDDINAFLAQLDRLPPEQRNKLEHIKPSKSLLSLAERLDDDALSQLADILISAGNTSIFAQEKRNHVPDELVEALSSLPDDILHDTMQTFASLTEQGDTYQAPTSPVGVDEKGRERILMTSSDRDKYWKHQLAQPPEDLQLLHSYTDLLISGKFKGDDLSTLNTHLQESTFSQSRGILDMANVIKPFEKHSMLAMLDEADKESEHNVFAYLSQQVDLSAHRQYYQTEKNDVVVQQDLPPSESDRGRLYSDILTAYDEYGLGWINDALEHTAGTPPQIQQQLWGQLLDDAEHFNEQFVRSDALESWASLAIPPLLQAFHDKQIDDIRDYNSERILPDFLGNLTFLGGMKHATAQPGSSQVESQVMPEN
ncbi:hypothetical protein CWB99_01455 [Pseudoalteromonas rubra]|uniref:Uncharacterized protein n=1 Tax=Pseudoalteromonas rubra TaxID=43658 RepID=A0A5S3WVB2_9GAMM|nr:hypothetical protein [Pseudoalteromonas rubra]TMP28126.1 hypothetical protein CWC00_22180 [Pseudoalteromonas rubra]TMP32790.1 hypothetical protein CWB99_01455 [Pseudoalteromonas rubra]